MRTIALVVEYDGTNYRGFQRQSSAPSIAAELETALETLCGHHVRLVAAGRTDAGVHATGQVVSFTTTSEFPLRRLAVAASALLRDRNVAVLKAVERPEGFSARFDALARTYRYCILNRPSPSPLEQHRVFHVSAELDLSAMRAAARSLLGTHDFAALCGGEAALCGGECEDQSTVRTITRLEIEKEGDRVHVEMTADSFLHRMVRITVGTLVEVARGKRVPDELADLLQSGDRARAGFTAPAHGLYLMHVLYAQPI